MYETLKTRTFLRSSFTRGFILFARDMQKDKCVGRYGVQEKTARFIASTWQKFLKECTTLDETILVNSSQT